jgi:alkylhydroperoxidase/carboxymuconolactone decarboxylase family protein YurZ
MLRVWAMSIDPSTASLAARRDAVRETFVRDRGFWAPPFEAILQADAEFLAAYLEFSAAPWRRGPLEPKVKEFVYIAADAAVTHMHAAGMAAHVRSALRHGASRAEIVSVLELTSLMGLQSLELGMPVLAANCEEPVAGETQQGDAAGDGWLDLLARLDPAGAQATHDWLTTVRSSSPLESKVIELLGVAVNASTTHGPGAQVRRL